MEIEKLLINDKIWTASPTDMSPKHVTFDLKIKRNKLQKWALTNHYANKFSKKEPTQFQSASIFFKFCPSVSPFVFAVLFILSINALRSYFYVSFTLVAVTTVWIIINFVTQPFSKLQKFFFATTQREQRNQVLIFDRKWHVCLDYENTLAPGDMTKIIEWPWPWKLWQRWKRSWIFFPFKSARLWLVLFFQITRIHTSNVHWQ